MSNLPTNGEHNGRPVKNGRGVSSFFERNAQVMLMTAAMVVGGVYGYSDLQNRVAAMEGRLIDAKSFAIVQDKIQALESGLANSVKEADVAVLKTRIAAHFQEIVTLYNKAELALRVTLDDDKSLRREIYAMVKEVSDRLSKLEGKVETRNGGG